MLKSISSLGTVMNTSEQQSINGGGFPESCPIAISLDGTLCLCAGWYPNGTGTCSPGFN